MTFPLWAEMQVLSESLGRGDETCELAGMAAEVKAALADAYDLHFTPAFLLQGFEIYCVPACNERVEC